MSRQRNSVEDELGRLCINLDDLPEADAQGWKDRIAAEERVLEENALYDARRNPRQAVFASNYAGRKRHSMIRFVPLTRKQKEAAKRLVHLMICGDIGK